MVTTKLIVAVAFVMMLAACGDSDYPRPDQCIRAKIFESCMKSLPAGPVSTQYNDWGEVVDACESAANYQSIRARSQIPKACSL